MKLLPLSIHLLLFLSLLACNADKDNDGFDYIVFGGDDCDDSNPSINPFAPDMVGDGIDQNCDGLDGIDADGDNYASLLSGGDDCDDQTAGTSGQITYYLDQDRDSFGDPNHLIKACEVPVGYAINADDCDDSDYLINPNAAEICDLVDNDCNQMIDDDDPDVIDQIDVYIDLDQDGFGTANETHQACFTSRDYADNADDCDDSDAGINPDIADIPYDGVDQDCNGVDAVSEVVYSDFNFSSAEAITAFCQSYSAVKIFGDVTINLGDLHPINSTEFLSCIVEIEGNLDIQNIGMSSIVLFDNLRQVHNLSLSGGGNYLFPSLVETEDLSISANQDIPSFSGDSSFPILQTINGSFSWEAGAGSELLGFTSLTSLGGLSILNNNFLVDLAAFPNITELSTLVIKNNYADFSPSVASLPFLSLSTPIFSRINFLELSNNVSLAAPALENLSSTSLLDVSGNSDLRLDICLLYTQDTNLNPALDRVSQNSFDFGNCDIDGDNMSINMGDCDDQDPNVNGLDSDGDGFNGCDDCDDLEASIFPNAQDTTNDGIDQNCDGIDGIDNDRDGHISSNDCDDNSQLANHLDLDNDGVTTCDDPNEIELVESCDDWYQAGFTDDGVYQLYLSSGDSFGVYCDMTTAGGGWTLFAITNSSACAEELNFGNIQLLDFNHPYFSTRLGEASVSEFLQDVRSDGENTDYTIRWNFLEGTNLMQNHFLYAASVGTMVDWMVDINGYQYFYIGDWFFSNSAFNNWVSHPWNDWASWENWDQWGFSTPPNFSADDGAWGATNGILNGNSDLTPIWGQAVSGSSDVNTNNENDCSAIYFNGEEYQSENTINLLYFR